MPLDLDTVADRVAALVGAGPADPDVVAAVDAAAEFVVTTGGIEAGEVPDTALAAQGMVGFSRALYLDALASRGANVVLGDQTVDTVFTPEDIYRHWRHYFASTVEEWGIA